LPLGLLPLGAHALGLGAMRVTSALGQPLAARIDIVGATTAEAELARISLASSEVSQRMGVDTTLGGVALRFAVKVGTDGHSYVSVSSVEPIREPYLDFVIEAISPSGQVARHYTILLDPVGSPPAPAAAATAAPRAWSPLVTPIPEVAPSPRPRFNPFGNVGLPKAGSTYGPVPPGTTLWSIARRVQPSGADLDTVMANIVRANPHAFIDGDPARLKAAVKLTIPDSKGLHEAAAAAPAPTPAAETPPPAPATATAPTPAAEPAPPVAKTDGAPAATAPEAQVRVLRGEDAKQSTTPAAAPTGGGDRVQLLEESLDAAQQQNEALQQRLGSLEEQIKTLTALVKAAPAGPDGAGTAASGGPTATVAPAPGAAPAVTSAATPTPKPASAPAADEQGLPMYLWAALAGLGLGGLALWSRRRRAAAAPRTFDDDVAPAVTPRSAPVAAAPVSTEVEWVEATPAAPIASPPAVEVAADGFGDPVDTQIDLLTAYVGMADGPSARQVYDEIQRTGTPAQKAQAQALLARLDA
jgi:pilus assembly protein FimV